MYIDFFRRNLTMAKLKGKGVVLAGLVAGAASLLSKKENRDKAMEYLSVAKEKAMQYVEAGKQNATSATTENDFSLKDAAEGAASELNEEINGNEMIGEGAQQLVNAFNAEQEQDQEQERK